MCDLGNNERIKKKEVYLDMLEKALQNVERDYMKYDPSGNLGNTTIKRAERVFAYELYHQFRKIMEQRGINDCFLNGEIRKNCEITEWEEKKDCYPDLVLHGNPLCIDPLTQYFMCEIKMASNRKLLEDLKRLSSFKKGSALHFQSYIFLCVGLTKEELSNKIIRSNHQEYAGDIICICKSETNGIEKFEINEVITKSNKE